MPNDTETPEVCRNVWNPDGWNIFVCMYEKGHDGPHGESVESVFDGINTVLASWSDKPGSVVWREVSYSSETITYALDSSEYDETTVLV